MFNSIMDGQTLSIINVLICLTSAIFLGLLIAFTHMKTMQSNKNFLVTLCLLPMLISVVMMMVNGNIGTSVAVLGAFSLVRFRSMPGNSREITSIFLAMTLGLAIGMGQILFALLTAILSSCVLFVLSIDKIFQSSNKHILKIVIPEDLDFNQIFDDLLEKYSQNYSLKQIKTINMGSLYEISYYIDTKENEFKELIDEIRIRNGNLKVSITENINEISL